MVKSESSIRVSRSTYSKLVRARGLLESFQGRRLSLADAIFISAAFTFNVLEYLSQCVAYGKLIVGSNTDPNDEIVFQLLAPDASYNFPKGVLKRLAELTEVLGEAVPKKAKISE